jgi:hypothetical protein
MIAPSNPILGWTIAEAIMRTSDLDHTANFANGNKSISNEQRVALRDRLFRGELIATGCVDAPTAAPVLIDRQILRNLDWSRSPSSTLNQAAGPEVEIFNVRVFPVLHAPNAGAYLDGLSLTDAFRRYVIDDPEVVVLAKRFLKTDARHSAVFLEGQAPGFFVDFHWSLDSTASAIAYQFVALPIITSGDLLPRPSVELTAVSEVLADRIQRLRDILADGRIVAFGTFAQTGVEGPIGHLQWIRSGISIHARNGDFCEGPDHRAVARWTGLSLRLPTAPLPLHAPQNALTPISVETPRRAKSQIQTKQKSSVECVAWLESIMRVSPETRTVSKSQAWAQAQSKWPKKFGFRAFEAAWTEAVAKAETPAWSAAGRPRKSPRY